MLAHPGLAPAEAAAEDGSKDSAETFAKVRGLLRDVIEYETPDAEDNDTPVDNALDKRLLCD